MFCQCIDMFRLIWAATRKPSAILKCSKQVREHSRASMSATLIRMYMNIYIIDLDGFAKLAQYNKTKLLAKITFTRYCLKTFELIYTKNTIQLTCESVSDFLGGNLNFVFFHIQSVCWP